MYLDESKGMDSSRSCLSVRVMAWTHTGHASQRGSEFPEEELVLAFGWMHLRECSQGSEISVDACG